MNDQDYFLEQFLPFVEQHYRAGGLTAASIGLRWKSYKPDMPWTHHGFEKLGDVLEAFVARYPDWELLYRHTPRVTLARSGEHVARGAMTPATASAPPTRALPKPLWSAFVTEAKEGTKRFYHRETGRVDFDRREAPHPPEDWVEIEPISQDEQRGWARQFLEGNSLADDPQLTQALDGAGWFLTFVEALRSRFPELVVSWNRTKSDRVYEIVGAWRQSHGIDSVRSYNPVTPRAAAPAGAAGVSNNHAGAGDSDSELRRCLMAALGRLHTHEILSMRLPVFAVVQALRPELLK